jgi:hypothetical protein
MVCRGETDGLIMANHRFVTNKPLASTIPALLEDPSSHYK